MDKPKIYSEIYGCSANLVDYEMMLGLLKEAGFELTSSTKNSDINLLVTCTVKVPTSSKMLYRAKELTKTNKPLIVAGCLPKVENERKIIEKINPKASFVGPNSIQKIVDVAFQALKGKKIVSLKDLEMPKICLPKVSKSSVIQITPISTGCNLNCSYCIVRYTKGNLVSYNHDLILKDVKEGVRDGHKEIWVTSQDNAAYNSNGHKLPQLLQDICDLEGDFFVRVGMMNPLNVKRILDELLDVYENEKIFKFLHIPLQSASNSVLKSMNRGYDIDEFTSMIRNFRRRIPKLTVSTDIIVGFPTESDDDFRITYDFMKKMRFDIVNVSKFGSRPGTLASKMKHIEPGVVHDRSTKIHKIVKEIEMEINKKWIGWEGKVIIDEKGTENSSIGRNFAYKTVVLKEKLDLGKFLEVKITNAVSNFLFGKIK